MLQSRHLYRSSPYKNCGFWLAEGFFFDCDDFLLHLCDSHRMPNPSEDALESPKHLWEVELDQQEEEAAVVDSNVERNWVLALVLDRS